MTEMILYSYWRSSCSYRVRIALYLKEIPFEYRAVHLVRHGGEQHGESYRRLNPLAEVPCLIHGDFTLTQSMAILGYLDRLKAEPALFPDDPRQEARVIQLCEIVNAGTQPLQNSAVLKALGERYAQEMEGRIDWARHWIGRGLAALEAKVRETAGRFCVGDRLTAVEVKLGPTVT